MSALSEQEWAAQRARKREIEEQNIRDPKFQTRPLGRAPRVEIAENSVRKLKRKDIEEKAKKHAVNIWSRPSHKKAQYDV